MIKLKNKDQLALMREAGRITAEALVVAGENIQAGMSTYDLDRIIREHIEKRGAKPSFLGYAGFPASACISINEEVIHGIPSKDRIIREGDLVKVDVGAYFKGFHGDSARTFAIGNVTDALKLMQVTKECFLKGVEQAVIGNRIGDIGSVINAHASKNGFTVVRQFVGHGVGHELHEDPEVPNYGNPGKGARLCEGMVIAIEPMINQGTYNVKTLSNEWTVVTLDKKLSAHYENTVAITKDGPVILTAV